VEKVEIEKEINVSYEAIMNIDYNKKVLLVVALVLYLLYKIMGG